MPHVLEEVDLRDAVQYQWSQSRSRELRVSTVAAKHILFALKFGGAPQDVIYRFESARDHKLEFVGLRLPTEAQLAFQGLQRLHETIRQKYTQPNALLCTPLVKVDQLRQGLCTATREALDMFPYDETLARTYNFMQDLLLHGDGDA